MKAKTIHAMTLGAAWNSRFAKLQQICSIRFELNFNRHGDCNRLLPAFGGRKAVLFDGLKRLGVKVRLIRMNDAHTAGHC